MKKLRMNKMWMKKIIAGFFCVCFLGCSQIRAVNAMGADSLGAYVEGRQALAGGHVDGRSGQTIGGQPEALPACAGGQPGRMMEWKSEMPQAWTTPWTLAGGRMDAAGLGDVFLTGMHIQEEPRTEPPLEQSLYASSAVLMDADTGRVLYGKNPDAPMAMASTTKIMTCILVLENVSLDDVLTVSSYAAGMPKVKLYIQKGEQYTVRDLLHSLMLESHNDSAAALAEFVGKRYLSKELQDKDTADYTAEESRQAVAAFASLMNKKAAELGCENTWFITPNGLDASETILLEDGSTAEKEHCTTAAELARIMSYCIKESPQREAFLEITRTRNYSFGTGERSFSCVNHNAFLDMMSGALTGKTGFTNKAGYCYVGALERDGRTFVVALLACGWPNNKNYKWSDTRELMEYGVDNYFYRSFSEEGTVFDESLLKDVLVQNGQTDILGGNAYTRLRIAERSGDAGAGVSDEGGLDGGAGAGISGGKWTDGLLMRADEQVRVEYHWKDTLAAPVEAGTEVGTIEYIVEDTIYKRETIVTVDSVEEIDLEWCMREILERFFSFS